MNKFIVVFLACEQSKHVNICQRCSTRRDTKHDLTWPPSGSDNHTGCVTTCTVKCDSSKGYTWGPRGPFNLTAVNKVIKQMSKHNPERGSACFPTQTFLWTPPVWDSSQQFLCLLPSAVSPHLLQPPVSAIHFRKIIITVHRSCWCVSCHNKSCPGCHDAKKEIRLSVYWILFLRHLFTTVIVRHWEMWLHTVARLATLTSHVHFSYSGDPCVTLQLNILKYSVLS